MARLPNSDQAFVAPEKITDYLLSHDHPRGRDKAAFFESFGFSMDEWEVLRDALIEHARGNPVVRVRLSASGTKYEISGPLPAPDDRLPMVKTVWIVEPGSPGPRFVTAVPD